AYYQNNQTAVQIGEASDYGAVAQVGPEFFDVFQLEPIAGRLFTDEEKNDDNSNRVVIGAGFWQQHFSGNGSAIGKEIRIYGRPFTIVGVLPPGFDYPSKSELWIPMSPGPLKNASRSGHNYRAVGRLKPDVSLEQAQAQMVALTARLEQLYPNSNDGKSAVVDRMRDALVSNIRPTLYVLLGAVG